MAINGLDDDTNQDLYLSTLCAEQLLEEERLAVEALRWCGEVPDPELREHFERQLEAILAEDKERRPTIFFPPELPELPDEKIFDQEFSRFYQRGEKERQASVNESTSPWAKAKPAPEFCAEEDKTIEGYAKDLVVPTAITVVAAPRGIGKTLFLHALAVAMAKGGNFRGEKVNPLRVMLIDRDNSRQIVKKRIRAWGGSSLDAQNLKILTREDAPDLKDKTAWESFPVKDYDVVLIDSVGSFTEGVTEKEGKETTEMLATLLDFIRKGPGVIALTNCTKDALNTRGRGEWQDRVDIQYEVRDATGFSPSGKKDWWLELPEAGESAWADRAARRKERIDYRLGFIPSKFRLGVQPEPFCLELRLPEDLPWTLSDVTSDLVAAGETSVKAAIQQKERTEGDALNALAEAVIAGSAGGKVMLKTEAVTYLQESGLSLHRSRELVTAKDKILWNILKVEGKGSPKGLFPVELPTADDENPYEGKIDVGRSGRGRQECDPSNPSKNGGISVTPFLSSVSFLKEEQEKGLTKDALKIFGGKVVKP